MEKKMSKESPPRINVAIRPYGTMQHKAAQRHQCLSCANDGAPVSYSPSSQARHLTGLSLLIHATELITLSAP